MAQMVKDLPIMQDAQVLSLDQENPLKKGMATHSSILGEFHGMYRPRGRKELDTTERLLLHFTFSLKTL